MGRAGHRGVRGADPAWGQERGLLNQYALADAETLVRLLLPARRHRNDRPTPWRQVAADYQYAGSLDGYISWSRLTQLPGDGGWEPPWYEAPGGRMSADMLRTLQQILTEVAGPDVRWRSSSPIASLSTGPSEGSLGAISALWTTSGFPGRAWTSDLRIGLAAPPYADSVIISGPAELRQQLTTSGLEAFPVSRRAPDPVTAE